MASLSCRISPRTSTVILRDRSPLATALVTSAMLRTCPVRLPAIELTLSKEGKEQWKFRVAGGPVMATPAVAGDRTFVAGCDSNLHVIDINTGKETTTVDIGGQT